MYNESDDEEPCIEEGEMVRDVMCVQNNADVVREALWVADRLKILSKDIWTNQKNTHRPLLTCFIVFY